MGQCCFQDLDFLQFQKQSACLAIRRRIERMAAVDAVRLASARLQASRAVAVPKSIQFLFSILVRLPCSLPRQSELRV